MPIPEPRPQRIKAGDANVRVDASHRDVVAMRRYSGYPGESDPFAEKDAELEMDPNRELRSGSP